MSLQQALKRPLCYEALSEKEQWEIDKDLNILDWEPTKKEHRIYKETRKLLKEFDKTNGCNKI